MFVGETECRIVPFDEILLLPIETAYLSAMAKEISKLWLLKLHRLILVIMRYLIHGVLLICGRFIVM